MLLLRQDFAGTLLLLGVVCIIHCAKVCQADVRHDVNEMGVVCVFVCYLSSEKLICCDAQRPPINREGVAGVRALEGLKQLRR